MRRLIWCFANRTYHIVGNFMHWLILKYGMGKFVWNKSNLWCPNNYNCHNIYWDSLIWLVKNGHLTVLSCILFFNELLVVFTRGGDIHGITSFLILCNAFMKRNGQSATTYTLLYALLYTCTDISGGKAKINIHTTLKLTLSYDVAPGV